MRFSTFNENRPERSSSLVFVNPLAKMTLLKKVRSVVEEPSGGSEEVQPVPLDQRRVCPVSRVRVTVNSVGRPSGPGREHRRDRDDRGRQTRQSSRAQNSAEGNSADWVPTGSESNEPLAILQIRSRRSVSMNERIDEVGLEF